LTAAETCGEPHEQEPDISQLMMYGINGTNVISENKHEAVQKPKQAFWTTPAI